MHIASRQIAVAPARCVVSSEEDPSGRRYWIEVFREGTDEIIATIGAPRAPMLDLASRLESEVLGREEPK